MLERTLEPNVARALEEFPVVALLGPRQSGKTTLASKIAAESRRSTLYLDLERPSDARKLSDAELYLSSQSDSLVILDEVQRAPELFPVLRSLIDERVAAGRRNGHFLVLGSASKDLLAQSSESLAGRIAYLELAPLTLREVDPATAKSARAATTRSSPAQDRLWLRGGFPPSWLAADDRSSFDWRASFVATYLERDLPQLGLRLPAEQVRRFWSMLAFGQGAQLNAARLAAGLGVTGNTTRHWLDVLTDLFVVRQLPAWAGSSGKRLVKAPKIYLRDSGLAHQLAGIESLEQLLGHPLCGPSFEAFAIENLVQLLPRRWRASYYRTWSNAEIDLVLEGPRRQVVAIEIKRTLAPVLTKGFRHGFTDIGATAGFFVMPSGTAFPLAPKVEAIALRELLERMARGESPFEKRR